MLKSISIKRVALALVGICIGGAAWAQDVKISGTVLDSETKEPVAGASIIVDGTTRGTFSDGDGRYLIAAPSTGTLVFSFMGYETVTIPVLGRSTIDMALTGGGIMMDEVVAIGYGTARKSDLTSAIASIGADDITKIPVSSIEQALQGNAAGVLVINTSAEPGGEPTVRIRGGSSISGDNEPLIVIDGFIADKQALAMLSNNDVQSIEVLKDAAATAIYGSRGANGVIMVTTKGGQQGKAKVVVDAKVGLNFPRRLLPMMDGPRYAEYDDLGRMAWGAGSVRSFMPDTFGTKDFQSQLVNDMGLRQEYTVSVSGGSQELKYSVSGGLLNEQGILANSSNERYTLRSKFTFALTKDISMNFSLNAGQQNQQKIGGGDGAVLRTGMLSPLRSSTGKYENGMFIDEETGEVQDVQSETAKAMNGNNWSKTFSADGNAQLMWKITDQLVLAVGGNFKKNNQQAYSYIPRYIYMTEANIDKNNVAKRGSSSSMQWTNVNTLTYSNTFGKKHYVNGMLAAEFLSNEGEGFDVSVRRFDTDYYMWDNLAAATYYNSVSSAKKGYSMASFFGRATYNYDKKYLATFTMRGDGSSRFGTDKKWGYFPSASLAWALSKENFMKPVSGAFNNLKLRASWGITGNDKIGEYQSQSLVDTKKILNNDKPYNGNVISQIGNEDLQWETTHQYDLGLDFGILGNRISGAVDVYYKQTFNLLYSYRLPASSGYTSVMSNVGNVDNKGVEFEITTNNLPKSSKLTWTTSFNIGYNKSEVTDLGGNDNVLLYYMSSSVNQNITFLKVGQPLAVFMGYKTSIYRDWNEVYADNAVWVEDPLVMRTQPGMLKYYDTNGDGVIDDDDKVILGQAQPTVMGGFTNTLRYRGFDFTIFFNGAWGNKVVNANVTKLMRFKGGADNQMAYELDAYRPIDPSTGDQGYKGGKYPVPSSNSNSTSAARDYAANLTDSWVEDASYLRLKSITLGYTFPAKTLKRWGISSVRPSVTGINLLTLTKYTGYDPEASSSSGSANSRLGIDLGSYPSTKGVTFALGITF